MVIAFDFDGVLDNIKVQKLAKKFIAEGNEVWVVTDRKENKFNKDKLSEVLNKVGIEYNIIYVDGKDKWELIQGISADIYIDNITSEFYNLYNHTKTVPLLFSGY